jgi:beta-lactamase class A
MSRVPDLPTTQSRSGGLGRLSRRPALGGALRGAALVAPTLLAACDRGAVLSPAAPTVPPTLPPSPDVGPATPLPAPPALLPSLPAPRITDLHHLQEYLERLSTSVPGLFAFSVHDLATDQMIGIHDGEPFPSASLIKLPILLRLLELVQRGTITLQQPIRLRGWHKTDGSGILQYFRDGLDLSLVDAGTAMIALSDNTAMNMVLEVTGVEPVNTMLDQLGCAGTRLHRYFGQSQTSGRPGISQAVPAEIGHLLALLARHAILTPALCEVALTMLSRQMHRSLIPRFLPEGTPIAHKSGSLDGVRHDAGIIWRPADGVNALPAGSAGPAPLEPGVPPPLPLIFVGMSQEVGDLRWTVENDAEITIGRAARVVNDYFAAEDPPASPK